MTELLVLILLLMFFILFGVPVAFAMGFTTILGILFFLNPNQLGQIASTAFTHGSSITLMVAPLFILMSEFLSHGGLAEDIFNVLRKWLRRIPGGLPISSVFACTIFAALCGSSPVTAATIGKISIPQLVAAGYNRGFSAGATAAGGTLGILIPPSLALIVFGIITETSISRLFIGGVIPGLVLSLSLALYILLIVKFHPELSRTELVHSQGGPAEAEKTSSLVDDIFLLVPIFILIVVVLGSMYLGFVTATEAGGIGALGAFLLILGLKRINTPVFLEALRTTAKTTSMLMFLIIFGMFFAFLVSSLGIPQEITKKILTFGSNKWLILIIVLIFWIIAGCFLDPTGLVVITMPLLFKPLVELGFEPIWIGVVATITVEIGMITPPIGLNLYVIQGITGYSFKEIVSGSVPFLFVFFFMLALVSIFPGIVMFLPNTMR